MSECIVSCRCPGSPPSDLEVFPEIGGGARVCAWCLTIFDKAGDVIPGAVGDYAQDDDSIATVWGDF